MRAIGDGYGFSVYKTRLFDNKSLEAIINLTQNQDIYGRHILLPLISAAEVLAAVRSRLMNRNIHLDTHSFQTMTVNKVYQNSANSLIFYQYLRLLRYYCSQTAIDFFLSLLFLYLFFHLIIILTDINLLRIDCFLNSVMFRCLCGVLRTVYYWIKLLKCVIIIVLLRLNNNNYYYIIILRRYLRV